MPRPYVMYGWHLSYFAGKLRCYLKYKRIPFIDPLDLRFRSRVRVPVPSTQAVTRVSLVMARSSRWLCSRWRIRLTMLSSTSRSGRSSRK